MLSSVCSTDGRGRVAISGDGECVREALGGLADVLGASGHEAAVQGEADGDSGGGGAGDHEAVEVKAELEKSR